MVSGCALLPLAGVAVAAASLVCGVGSGRGSMRTSGRAGRADCLVPVNDVNHEMLAFFEGLLTISKQPDACC